MAFADEGVRSYSPGDTIQFDDASTANLGNAYDPASSVFTCLVRGVYLFTTTLYNVDEQHMEAVFHINDVSTGPTILVENSGYNQASNTLIRECQAGDRVSVKVGYGVSRDNELSNDIYWRLSTFSGVLIQLL